MGVVVGMKQVVVTTERDDIVAEGRVTEARLLMFLAPWIFQPEHLVYIEGELISDEQRKTFIKKIETLMAEQAEPAGKEPARAATATPSSATVDAASVELIRQPERLKSVVDIVNGALQSGVEANIRIGEELCKSQLANLNTLNTVIARYGQLSVEGSHQLAVEHARQRGLVHQALADIDLLDRSVATKRVVDRFARVAGSMPVAAAVAQGAPRGPEPERSGFSFQDFLHGLVCAVRKLNQSETKE